MVPALVTRIRGSKNVEIAFSKIKAKILSPQEFTATRLVFVSSIEASSKHVLEYGAGEGGLVEPELPPDLDQGRDEHAEAEGPHREDHQEDVRAGVDPLVGRVARDEHVPA